MSQIMPYLLILLSTLIFVIITCRLMHHVVRLDNEVKSILEDIKKLIHLQNQMDDDLEKLSKKQS